MPKPLSLWALDHYWQWKGGFSPIDRLQSGVNGYLWHEAQRIAISGGIVGCLAYRPGGIAMTIQQALRD